jgi:hypothetical protein
VTALRLERDGAERSLDRRVDDESIGAPDPPDNAGVKALATRLARKPTPGVRLVARITVSREASASDGPSEVRAMAELLGTHVAILSLDAEVAGAEWDDATWAEFLRDCVGVVRDAAPACLLWLVIRPDREPATAAQRVDLAHGAGIRGVVVDGGVSDAQPGWRRMGRPAKAPALAMVRSLRNQFPDRLAILASGGVHEPADALDFQDAGADLVAIDSGLVYSGPGLPKRVNEAVLYADQTPRSSTAPDSSTPVRRAELSWFWLFLLGLSMLVGSTLALAIAATRVVLPYDEQFVGMNRAALDAINQRLLPFMTHDRVTLAGTMVTIGAMYCGLSWYGVRQGLHWAMVAVQASAFAGFTSFFLFLGFGYFDPFHAFVTVALLQLLLMGVHARLGPPAALPAPALHNDARWRRSLWGQLLFVMQAVAFIVAGAVISLIGATTVFVPEDLHYMETTASSLHAANPRLLSLIAHDRASFGGMLVASGLVFLMSALWGFRRGARWLWWTTLLAGAPGYTAAIGVHFVVGYENLWHLMPAFLGLAMFLAGLALTYAELCLPDLSLAAEWNERLAAWTHARGNGGRSQ